MAIHAAETLSFLAFARIAVDQRVCGAVQQRQRGGEGAPSRHLMVGMAKLAGDEASPHVDCIAAVGNCNQHLVMVAAGTGS